MKLGQKLALGFFVAVLCVWLTSFLAKSTLTNIHREFELLKEDIIPGAIAMAEMDGETTEIAYLLMDYMNTGKEEYLEKIQSAIENIKKLGLVHKEHETHIGLEEQKAADELVARINGFIAAIEKIIDLKKQGVSVDELAKIEVETVYPAMAILTQQLERHKAVHMKELAEAQEAVLEAHSFGMRLLLLSVVIITLLSVAISFYITRSIVKSIHALHKGIEIIGKGNLDYKVGTDSKDEIGELSRAFDEMSEKLKKSTASMRESEEKLARSKKMESLGLLAGGVAHDLNNVLSGIVSYPELLLLDLPEDSKLRKPITTIQESGHRATAIVQDLLTMARGVAATKEPLNLNDLIGDYLNSPEFKKLEHIYPTVEIKTNLDSDLFNVSGSNVHIRKMVMDLVLNAMEAIDGSGNVTISTMNRYIDRPLRGYDNINIGEYVVLAVSDDGPGISSDDLKRIFEPFFTKKVMGRSGTGLGLAVVWNVVQDHKGYIDVTTDENGTTFELYFPITREEISGKDLSIPIKDYKGNGETILVVDDMENQREISCNILDRLGYKTKAVSSGEEAVEYLKENTVDLLFLDMIMDPGINGRETYERIIEIHPKQKAIIVSGFAETDEVKKTQKLGAGQYIKKPLTLKKIGLAVKKELEK